MALRQREWAILIRPYYMKDNIRINYTGTPKAGYSSDLGYNSTNTATELSGEAEGMDEEDTLPIEKGGWVLWYKTISYEKLRRKYKECLDTIGKEHTRIVEMIPTDIMITPFS